MKLATSLRNSLGLSQHQLSAFLGGSRSILSRSEKGLRNLTSDAVLNLLTLYQTQATMPTQTPEQAIEPDLTESWQLHAKTCRHKAVGMKRQLAAMEDSWQKACRLRQCLEQLLLTKSAELSDKQIRWVEIQRYEAGKKMAAMNYGSRRQLALKIEALEAEAAIYEKGAVVLTDGR